jgi:hypothetical protein
MTDEVTRLRRLRQVALKARALAEVLRTAEDRRDSVTARGALLCWRIARLCTGRLRAHPYEAFQRGPTLRETLNDGVDVIVAGLIARRRARRASCFQTQLRIVSQTLADVRALTLIPELSDDFGRCQMHMRQILSELSLRAALERGMAPAATLGSVSASAEVRDAASPYLAL